MAKGQSAFKVSENFFKKFGAKAEQIAKEEARNMAIDMQFILKNRSQWKVAMVDGHVQMWLKVTHSVDGNKRTCLMVNTG